MDIQKRKPRIINLKYKKVVPTFPAVQRRLKIDDPEVKPEPGVSAPEFGNEPCIQCGTPQAKEMGRCPACQAIHQKLVTQLDSQPRQNIQKVPEKWVYYQEIKGGVKVTTRMTEQEALWMGKKIQ